MRYYSISCQVVHHSDSRLLYQHLPAREKSMSLICMLNWGRTREKVDLVAPGTGCSFIVTFLHFTWQDSLCLDRRTWKFVTKRANSDLCLSLWMWLPGWSQTEKGKHIKKHIKRIIVWSNNLIFIEFEFVPPVYECVCEWMNVDVCCKVRWVVVKSPFTLYIWHRVGLAEKLSVKLVS